MQITKLSTKGQIVIPEEIRDKIKVVTPFVVTREGDLIILKKVEGLTKEEMKEMKELDKIWKDIDEGKGVALSEKEFFKEMDTW